MSEDHEDYEEKLGDDLAEFLADPNQEKFSLQEHWKHICGLMDSPYLDPNGFGFGFDNYTSRTRHEVEEIPRFAQDASFYVRSDVHRFAFDRFQSDVYEKRKVSNMVLRPLCKSYAVAFNEGILTTIKQSAGLVRMPKLLYEENLNGDRIVACLYDAADLLIPHILADFGVVISRKFQRGISRCFGNIHPVFAEFAVWNLDPHMNSNEAFLMGDFDSLHCFDASKQLILKKEPSNFGAAADVRMTGLHSVVLFDTLKQRLDDNRAAIVLAGFGTTT